MPGRLAGAAWRRCLWPVLVPAPLIAAARARGGAEGSEGTPTGEADEEGAPPPGGDAEEEQVRRKRAWLERLAGVESAKEEDPFWARAEVELDGSGLPPVGTVLLANPAAFFVESVEDADGERQAPAATYRCGIPPNMEAGAPRQERTRLPVVLITRRDPQFGTTGLLLGIWMGKLLGDLHFTQCMTRPLYMGGRFVVQGSPPSEEQMPLQEKLLGNITILHSYPDMPGAQQLTADGLAVSLEGAQAYEEACKWINEGPGSSLRLKFFYNQTWWAPDEEAELLPQAGVWLPVQCSRDFLLREPDSAFEESLWVQIAELAGGDIAEAARRHSLFPEKPD